MSDVLGRWPAGRRVGLLALTAVTAKDPEEFFDQLPGARRFWSATAENAVVGPFEDPPFARMHLVEVADAAAARRVVAELASRFEPAEFAVLAASPLPKGTGRILRALLFLLRRLPSPRAGELASAHASGGANPTPEQIERLFEERGDTPVLVLNLNLHKEVGTDPDTGRPAPGRRIAARYFRRGMATFSRLGARLVWAGACRGRVAGALEAGTWDQIGLVWYPSRASFVHLVRVPAYAAAGRYRAAGLERSWVIQCRVTASSARRGGPA